MFNCGNRGCVSVLSGRPNGRSTHDDMMNGTIVIKADIGGEESRRSVRFVDGEIVENKLISKGKTVHHVRYGVFEKVGKTEILRYNGTGKSKHGKSRRRERLFGHDGICHSWYKNGRLMKQEFIYDNRIKAYNYNAFKKVCNVRGYEGNPLFEVKGILDGRMNSFRGCHSVFQKPRDEWFSMTEPFEVKENGKVVLKGQMKNRQRVGEWVIDGEALYFEHGVAIPMNLYKTPPEKLDLMKVLKHPNAQVRMALMAKIGTDRIAKAGKVIHKDGAMRLYDIKGYDVKILRVQCPTTKSFYYLRVPHDSKKCEEARQWTFHVGTHFNKPINFAVET